jgi:hypothetical protein
MNKHIVQLIRERFYPLVRFCGPQSAGEVEIEGVRATVYLGELSIWLWPAKSSHNGVLSDEQLGDVVMRLCSRCTVTFDSSRAPKWLRFRINDGSITLTKANPDFHVSELADWSDEKLYQMIEAVTDGLVKKSA